MKKKTEYISPDLKVYSYEDEDVITTSPSGGKDPDELPEMPFSF